MKQVLEAVAACHEENVVHGNIRFDTVLLTAENNAAPIKVCGFSSLMHPDCILKSLKCQINDNQNNHISKPFINCFPIAPELVTGHFQKATDIYDCGVLLYTLLCGSCVNFCFKGHENLLFLANDQWNHISDKAKDLVIKMTATDPNKRLSVYEALQHDWICQKEIYTYKFHLVSAVEEMRRFNSIEKIKKKISELTFSEVWEDERYECLRLQDNLIIINSVDDIFQSLDKVMFLISLTLESNEIVKSLISDVKLKELLELYDYIEHLNKFCANDWVDASALENYNHIFDTIKSLPSLSESIEKLINILNSPFLKNLMKAYNVIVKAALQRTEPLQDNNSFSQFGPEIITTNEEPNRPIRIVQFQKTSNEPLGITLKLDEQGRCIVSRIMHGGMIHRQATLHVGDEINEINGISVANQSVENLQRMLREAKGNITFKILPSYKTPPIQCQIFVRAQFNYDPKEDELIPSRQAGLSFSTGDVLEIICKDDYYWWQARRVGESGAASLIPSAEIAEWRATCNVVGQSKKNKSNCKIFRRKKKRDLLEPNASIDPLDIATYEEVVFLPVQRKTLVLLGPHGVGRRHIKNTLISNQPNTFSYPIPHTTRLPRKNEEFTKQYYFVTQEEMLQGIANHEFLEYGSYQDSIYGLKIDTIREIISDNKVAILDVEPQALKILRTGEFTPFVIFIAAPSLITVHDEIDNSLQKLLRESEFLQQAYNHLFDLIVINNDIEETVKIVEQAFRNANSFPQWVPVNWIY